MKNSITNHLVSQELNSVPDPLKKNYFVTVRGLILIHIHIDNAHAPPVNLYNTMGNAQ